MSGLIKLFCGAYMIYISYCALLNLTNASDKEKPLSNPSISAF